MAEGNTELVRRIYEDGLFDDHPEQLLPLLSPDVELVNPSEAVEGGVRRGVEEIFQAHASVSGSFESSRHELKEVFGSGDVVVASLDFRARPRGATEEAEICQQEAHTWTLRDGRIIKLEWGRDLRAALRAAGISE